jgi:hypothetical protein
LFVADIHEHAVKNWQDGALCRNRNSRLSRQRRHANGFQRNRFATGVRPADHQHALFSVERE